MQNTGQGSNKSYRVLLLLVVGLAAFSHAIKELNEVRNLTLQSASFLAQLKETFAPAGDLTTVSVETCQNNREVPPPPLPVVAPLPPVPAAESAIKEVEVPEVAPAPPAAPAARPITPKAPEVPQPRRVMRPAHSPAEVRVFVSTDDFETSIKDAFETNQSLKALKAKNRRYFYQTPDSHDVILKTFNRSFNLRSAS